MFTGKVGAYQSGEFEVNNVFFFVASVFVPCRSFQPSLIFTSKPGAYKSGALERIH
jgi:hypothetical protein